MKHPNWPKGASANPAGRPKGVGKLQRRIRYFAAANPGGTARTSQLAEWCYPRADMIGLNERKAIFRAASKICERVGRPRRSRGRWGEVLWRLPDYADAETFSADER